jgi:ATP-binding protein involved in chromosome partitioning
MSIVYYSHDLAAPLRGLDVSNALIELLAVTTWGKLDFLVLDMPPGIGDATLDLIRLIDRVEFLVVTTPSQLAFETVRKLASLLKELKLPVIGIVENMKMTDSSAIERHVRGLGLKFLGQIPYDATVEGAIGNTRKLLSTTLARRVNSIAEELVNRKQ